MNPTETDYLELSRNEVRGMKEKLPKNFRALSKPQLDSLYTRVELFEKELEKRHQFLLQQKEKERANQLYKLLNDVFDVRITLEELVKPTGKEDTESLTEHIDLTPIPTGPVGKGPVPKNSFGMDQVFATGPPPSAKNTPLPIIEMESLSLKDGVDRQNKAVKIQTFPEFRKQWLKIMFEDQAPVSKGEPEFSFRVVNGGLNKGWQPLPPLPSGFMENYRSDTPLPPAYNNFRLFPIFFELSRLGYISVAYLYNWKRKMIGAYRNLLASPSRADLKAIRSRSEQLFPSYIDHLLQNEDRIIHIDFFGLPSDRVPLMVWTFSEDSGSVRAMFARETFISKNISTEDDYFDVQ